MKIRTRGLFAGLMLAAVALAATATVDPNRYLNDIKFLASPELRGRGTGSPELEKAAAFLERHYRQLGIKPAGKSYLQSFPVTTGKRPFLSAWREIPVSASTVPKRG